MTVEEKPDRKAYRLIKMNLRTAVRIEVYPHFVRGLLKAQRMVEELNDKLTQKERDSGVSWFLS
jgi:hypothetical protein